MRKYGVNVLGLILMAAVGLMALGATSALAVNLNLGDKFYENNAARAELLVNNGAALNPVGLAIRIITATQLGSARLAIPAKKAEIVCKEGGFAATAANEYENFIIPAMEIGAHADASLVAKGCTTEEINAEHKLTGKKLTGCVPNYDTTPGEIVADMLLLGKNHEGVTYVLAVPEVTAKAKAEANEALTSAFTKIKFNIETCVIPTANVTGSVSFKWPVTVPADSVKPVLKINTLGGDALIGTKLKYGANEAFIEGEYEAELPTNPGVPWGVM